MKKEPQIVTSVVFCLRGETTNQLKWLCVLQDSDCGPPHERSCVTATITVARDTGVHVDASLVQLSLA